MDADELHVTIKPNDQFIFLGLMEKLTVGKYSLILEVKFIKKISTKQEKSYFIMHNNEYKEYGLKLRKRRKK